MTSKERARLRGLANGIETVLQIGKDGIGENLIHQADITLEARELIKGRVLEGCANSPREAAEALAAATNSEVIQVIGSKFVLYRKKKSVETEKKASKPGQRKKPPLALRDISPKGGDARGKAGKRFRAPSDMETGRHDKKRFGAKVGRRDKISDTETGERSKKRSPAPMGRGTRPNAFRKSDAAQRANRPGARKASQSSYPGKAGAGPRKPFDAQRKPLQSGRPGPRKARDGENRRK